MQINECLFCFRTKNFYDDEKHYNICYFVLELRIFMMMRNTMMFVILF